MIRCLKPIPVSDSACFPSCSSRTRQAGAEKRGRVGYFVGMFKCSTRLCAECKRFQIPVRCEAAA